MMRSLSNGRNAFDAAQRGAKIGHYLLRPDDLDHLGGGVAQLGSRRSRKNRWNAGRLAGTARYTRMRYSMGPFYGMPADCCPVAYVVSS